MIWKRHIFDVLVFVVVATLGIGMIFSGLAFGPKAAASGGHGLYQAPDFEKARTPHE